MGRPPCCDKVGVKKGPWTPEEDIILVSYVREHGPGNWSAVPTNTGLMRCSKSCRLRWINYLRPGIKRGNFTPHEEGIIIHLQALLGNKWAAIASYLPQRTDNDIKNYWNTHLKKKLKKHESSVDPRVENYASSAENISRLMQNWMKSCSSSSSNMAATSNLDGDFSRDFGKFSGDHELETISPLDHSLIGGIGCNSGEENGGFVHGEKMKIGNDPPLLFLEKWLMDENSSLG